MRIHCVKFYPESACSNSIFAEAPVEPSTGGIILWFRPFSDVDACDAENAKPWLPDDGHTVVVWTGFNDPGNSRELNCNERNWYSSACSDAEVEIKRNLLSVVIVEACYVSSIHWLC